MSIVMLRLVGRLDAKTTLARTAVTRRQHLVATRRSLSSSRGPAPAPKRAGMFNIPAQGFVFSALLLPVLGFTFYAGSFGPSEEHVEHEIRQRYADRNAQQRDKNAAMADFFQHAIHKPDGSVDNSLQQVLYAGKGGKKRMYAVDETLYGTEAGVAEKNRQEEERKKRAEYRRKKKAGESVEDENESKKKGKNSIGASSSAKEEAPPKPAEAPAAANGGAIVINAQSAATLGAVAVLAAGVGFLAGGSRR